jgi:hypothetical protein
MTSTESNQTFRVGAECAIVVETTSGDVEIRGWDRDEVAVPGDDEARLIRDDNGVTVRAPVGGSADLSLRVPQRCKLTVRTASGDLDVRDMTGGLSVQTMSGDLTARDIRGGVRISSVSGDVVISHSRLRGLSVDTVSGDLAVESALDPEGDYHVRSVSGDLSLSIPEDQGLTVHSTTLSGDFRCDLPHEVDRRGWGKLDARVNGGGVPLRVRTASGDLHIRAWRGVAAEVEEAAEPEPQPQRAAAPEPFAADPFAPGAGATRPLEDEPETPAAEPFDIDEPVAPESDESLPTAARRMAILRAIEEGRLTVGEGLARLRALD